MSEKLSPLNDVSSVIFSSSGLGLNKDNAHCRESGIIMVWGCWERVGDYPGMGLQGESR